MPKFGRNVLSKLRGGKRTKNIVLVKMIKDKVKYIHASNHSFFRNYIICDS